MIRFKTRISKEGTIQIPLNTSLRNKEVEVILFPQQKKLKRSKKAHEFVEKWAGFLTPLDSEDSRFEYLMAKYR